MHVIVYCVLLQESNIEFDSEQKKPFFELHYILESLQRKDLDPALRLLIVCDISVRHNAEKVACTLIL